MTDSWKHVYEPGSPIRCALDQLANKWTLLVLGRLFEGPAQFGELHRSIGGVSKKVLTDYLRRLERDGLVARQVRNGRTSTVEYSLTALGASAREALDAMRVWAEQHHDEVRASRERYDATTRTRAEAVANEGEPAPAH